MGAQARRSYSTMSWSRPGAASSEPSGCQAQPVRDADVMLVCGVEIKGQGGCASPRNPWGWSVWR